MKPQPKPLILSLTLLLAGCSGGLLAPAGSPAKLYTLSAPREIASTAPQVAWQLIVQMPDAAMQLNSARIAISPAPARIDYYADVAWTDRPPAILQELLLQSFDKSGKISGVQHMGGSARADFELSTDLQQFQVDAVGDPPSIHVEIAARLIRARDRSIVASRQFAATEPAGANFDATIGGFDVALQRLLPRIVDWTLEQGSRNP